jgi:succinylglutamic semialdehyde dehydrogenase
MTQQSLFINGDWFKGSGPSFISINPATGEALWEGPSASKEDVSEAVVAARKAFEKWSLKDPGQRETYLRKFAEALKVKKENFATQISEETGKPFWEALTEVDAMIGKIEISIRSYSERCKEVAKEKGIAISKTRFKSHGVVAVFGPFNLPGHLPNGHIVPALLSGNTVVFKPSDQTPFMGMALMALWDSVGLPKGVLNLVQGAKQTGIHLSKHPGLSGLYFTGSSNAGKQLHKAFGGQPEKILALEMGGNNPLIVSEVSNAEAAIYSTLQSAFITSGQRCVCARRLIVLKGTKGEVFTDRLVKAAQKIKVGPHTSRPEPFMGPVISEAAGQSVLEWQTRLEKEGGQVLLKSEPLDQRLAMLSPGIMDVTHIKSRPDVEIFGPFLQVIRVPDFDEALLEANRTKYGLAAGLLSDSEAEYKTFFEQSRAGVVNWNQPITGASSEAPFGGVGQSGNHRPSAYFAADYCSYAVASLEASHLTLPEKLLPGIELK